MSLLLNVSGEVMEDEERMAYIVTEKGSVTFTCSFLADPTPNVTWLQDGKSFDTNQPHYIVDKRTTSLGSIGNFQEDLTIISAVLEDSGHYICMVANSLGVVNTTAAVLVVIGQ